MNKAKKSKIVRDDQGKVYSSPVPRENIDENENTRKWPALALWLGV